MSLQEARASELPKGGSQTISSMSGARDDQWRPARGNASSQSQNRQNNQQQRRNQSRDAGQGTAWQSNERSSRDTPPQALPHETHVPVRGFNALEIRDTLKQAYYRTLGEDAKAMKYKAPAGQANSAKPGGPWGSKANTMGNGKDFFLELRKQVSALQQSAERAGG